MYRATPGSQSEQVGRLLTAGVLVVFAPALPFGNYLIYPFMILATWFHEMGHGLTALAFGYEFERLVIYSNGSGLAESSLPADASRFSRALIAAGGPLGPSLIGAALILASAKEKFWRPALYLLAFAIAISTGIWVRSSTCDRSLYFCDRPRAFAAMIVGVRDMANRSLSAPWLYEDKHRIDTVHNKRPKARKPRAEA